jgi:parallel beta-helix repeat protein
VQTEGKTINVPSDYPTIQEAINNAEEGDTVFVQSGVYYENVILNKSIALVGEDKEKTVIDGNGSGITLKISCERALVMNFTVKGGGSEAYESGIFIAADGANVTENIIIENGLYGIYLNNSFNSFIEGNIIRLNGGDGIVMSGSINITVINNIVMNNSFGIHLYSSHQNFILSNVLSWNSLGGINLFYSSQNSLTNNSLIENVGFGIILDYSSNDNKVISNNITSTFGYGLTMGSGSNNTLRNNNLNANKYNFYCIAAPPNLSNFLNDIDESNIINGKSICYIINREELIIDPKIFNNIGYLALINCTNIIIQDLDFSENGQGIFLAFTNNSMIKGVRAEKNNYGIQLLSSNNVTVVNSTLANNDEDGLTIDYSSTQNIVAYNIIVNNTNGIRMAHHTNENCICNNIMTNNAKGLWIYSYVDDNVFINNTLTNNNEGISMARECRNNTITQNGIANNTIGVKFNFCSNNLIFKNNFIDNTVHAANPNSTNIWDDGYPSGGNYWSDYAGVDVYWGPNQNQPGSDGIGDTPHTIDEENKDRYPLMALVRFHDLTIVGVVLPSSEVYVGWVFNVNVSVRNNGSYVESVNVTVYCNDSLVGFRSASNLAVGEVLTLGVSWNTSGLRACNSYNVRAEVSIVVGETYVEDNVFVWGFVKVKMVGDVSGDGLVNILDIHAIAKSFGSEVGGPKYSVVCDMNLDGLINIVDLFLAAKNFNKTCV